MADVFKDTCNICGQELSSNEEDHCFTQCSSQKCGDHLYHPDCIRGYKRNIGVSKETEVRYACPQGRTARTNPNGEQPVCKGEIKYFNVRNVKRKSKKTQQHQKEAVGTKSPYAPAGKKAPPSKVSLPPPPSRPPTAKKTPSRIVERHDCITKIHVASPADRGMSVEERLRNNSARSPREVPGMEFADPCPRNVSKRAVVSLTNNNNAFDSGGDMASTSSGGSSTNEDFEKKSARFVTNLDRYNEILLKNGLLPTPVKVDTKKDREIHAALKREQLHQERLTNAVALWEEKKAVLEEQNAVVRCLETNVEEAYLAVQAELQELVSTKDIIAVLRAFDTHEETPASHRSSAPTSNTVEVEIPNEADRDKYGVIHWGNSAFNVAPVFDFDNASDVANLKLRHADNNEMVASEVFEKFIAECPRDERHVCAYLEGLFANLSSS